MELIKEIKQSKILRNVFIALMGTVFLAISSKIKIPFYPVPMTMQTLVVLFLGITLGWKLGVATVALYLFEGVVGLPVFSGTPEKGVGIIYFTGPTMGYLIGFLATVFFSGFFNYNNNLFNKFFGSSSIHSKIIIFFSDFIKLSFAISFIYLFGMIWLGTIIGWNKPIYEIGAQPFLLAELFKILIVLFSLSKLKKINQYLK